MKILALSTNENYDGAPTTVLKAIAVARGSMRSLILYDAVVVFNNQKYVVQANCLSREEALVKANAVIVVWRDGIINTVEKHLGQFPLL